MELEKESSKKSAPPALNVPEQVAQDLEIFINSYSNRNYALRLLAKRTGINEKTLRRLAKRENRPSFSTLFRLYFLLTQATHEDEMLQRCPPVIRKELEQKEASTIRLKHPDPDQSFLKLVQKQPLYAEIYILVAVREELPLRHIVERYGRFGVEIVESLVRMDLIRKLDRNILVLSPGSPVFDGKMIKVIGMHFVDRFIRPENTQLKGSSALSFYACGLNENGYKKWLEIDEEAYYKKLNLSKQREYQGALTAFTFSAVDTMDSGEDS